MAAERKARETKSTGERKSATSLGKRRTAAHASEVHAPPKARPDSPLIARLREICMALPEANERLSHGEPTWFAGKGRSFAMLDNHHHGAPHLSVWLPQPLGVQQMLVDADPKRFFRPPYVGVSGWIGVVLDTKPDWKLVASLVRDAYLHVATQKLAKQVVK
jgi:predicted DNA-binding protein (MmcQ/YjbR family)